MYPTHKTANRFRSALATAMLLTGVATNFSASADEDVRAETVKFHDLNVNSPAGVQTLYARIHGAATRMCTALESDLIAPTAAVACARKAEANAVEKLSLPQLTQYYKSKNAEPSQPLVAAR